ncbi:MAG: ATP-binding protein, partial [Gammaproteobacteria bacterium]|nr:ATP-binding protein [Gammaproteobacteria bacterium]
GGGSGTAGHGLGLAVCKGLVEAHGGRIRAASDGPGRGPTITFTPPAAEAGRGAPPPRPVPRAHKL